MAKSTQTQTVKDLIQISAQSGRSMIAVIDAMAQRGAYKGEELQAIGELRSNAARMIQLAETAQSEGSEG